MKRSLFALWGSRLNEDDFARAIAALGVLFADNDALASRDRGSRAGADLTRAIGGAEAPIPCSFDRLQSGLYGVRDYDPSDLAAAWRSVVIDKRLHPRLEITALDEDVLNNPWLIEQLSLPAVEVASVYVRKDDSDRRTPWLRPIRVGLLGDALSSDLAGEIRQSPLLGSSLELVAMSSPGAACDLLVLPLGLRSALAELLATASPIRCDCAVILGGMAGGADGVDARLAALRAEVRSGGASIINVDEGSRLHWLTALLLDLGTGAPLDIALFGACRAVNARAPLVIASRRLIEMTDASITKSSARGQKARKGGGTGPGGATKSTERRGRKPEETPVTEGLTGSAVPPPPIPRRMPHIHDSEIPLYMEVPYAGDENDPHGGVDEIDPRTTGDPNKEQEPSFRSIQARIFDCSDIKKPVRLARAMRAMAPHLVEARIGRPSAVFASLADRFPEEKLPPQIGATRLTIVFTEPHLSPTPQVETIDLPREGDSTSALFVVQAREGISRMEARILVLHENRVLQTAILRADIVSEPNAAPAQSVIELVPEVFVSLGAGDLSGRPPWSAALVLDRGGITTVAGEYVAQVSLGETDIVVRDLADKLSAVVSSESTHLGLESDAASKLLRTLAHQGRLLYDALFADSRAREAITDAPRIQVVSARPGAFLPIEFVYEKRVPDEGARVCSNAESALRTGQCAPQCPKGKDARKVICPLGFWGLSRVIERQSDGELPQGKDFGVRLTAGPRKRLRVLDSALFAASRRVDAVEASAATALSALREAIPGGRVATADSWERWEELVASAKPSLLVLLTHTETNNTPVRALEIGEDKLLAMSAIYPDHIRASDDIAPVVLLIGCRTSVVDKKFQEFPVVFQRNGAAIVLGTVASILGRDAGPVTARLITVLRELLDAREISFGDALLAAKQRLFAEGFLAAMTLCAHGDAAWILNRTEASSNGGFADVPN